MPFGGFLMPLAAQQQREAPSELPSWEASLFDVQGELTLAPTTLQANGQEGHAAEQCLAQNYFVWL